LDVVEERTENLIEKSLDYYNHGKVIVEKGKNMVENKKELMVEKGHEIYDDKIHQINGYYSTGKKTIDEKKEEMTVSYKKRLEEYKKAAEEIKRIGDDMYLNGKEKVMTVYTHTREEYFDKPQKFIADLLQSKYENLKEQYPSVKKVDELVGAGKKVAEVQKEKAVEVYSKTCKYYSDQKEAAKQLGSELIRQAHDYLKNTLASIEEENQNDANKKPDTTLTEIGYEVVDYTKQEMANVTKKYLLFALRSYEAIKSKLSPTHPNQEEDPNHPEEKKQDDVIQHQKEGENLTQQ